MFLMNIGRQVNVNSLSAWCEWLLFLIQLAGFYCDTNILVTMMDGLEELKENSSDFSVVKTDEIQESQTYSLSTRLTGSRILKLHESIVSSREDSFTRKFLFAAAFLF